MDGLLLKCFISCQLAYLKKGFKRKVKPLVNGLEMEKNLLCRHREVLQSQRKTSICLHNKFRHREVLQSQRKTSIILCFEKELTETEGKGII